MIESLKHWLTTCEGQMEIFEFLNVFKMTVIFILGFFFGITTKIYRKKYE